MVASIWYRAPGPKASEVAVPRCGARVLPDPGREPGALGDFGVAELSDPVDVLLEALKARRRVAPVRQHLRAPEPVHGRLAAVQPKIHAVCARQRTLALPDVVRLVAQDHLPAHGLVDVDARRHVLVRGLPAAFHAWRDSPDLPATAAPVEGGRERPFRHSAVEPQAEQPLDRRPG